MSGKIVEFAANGRTCEGYLSIPGSGSGPGLIVIQEYWGLVDHIKHLTDRFAAAGFVSLAPDLYHGERTKSPDDAGRLMMALNIAESGKDLRGAADFLLRHETVAPKRVAAIGFCMGGQLALFAAAEHSEISAAIDFYGIHPHVKPAFGKTKAKVQCHFANDDAYVSKDSANALIAEMKSAGVSVESYFYEAGHAFLNDSRPEAYDERSATLAWDRTVAFLRSTLG